MRFSHLLVVILLCQLCSSQLAIPETDSGDSAPVSEKNDQGSEEEKVPPTPPQKMEPHWIDLDDVQDMKTDLLKEINGLNAEIKFLIKDSHADHSSNLAALIGHLDMIKKVILDCFCKKKKYISFLIEKKNSPRFQINNALSDGKCVPKCERVTHGQRDSCSSELYCYCGSRCEFD